MTRSEREMLVERYLAFEMCAEQEQEFIMQAAVDGELRQILRASRLVDRALEKNRDAHAPVGHTDVRERALALLAATPALTPPTPEKTTPTSDRRTHPFSWPALATTALLFTLAGFFSHELLLPEATPSAVLQPAAAPGPLKPQAVPSDSSALVMPSEVAPKLSSPDADPAASTAQEVRATRPAPTRTTASTTERTTGRESPPAARTEPVTETPRTDAVPTPSEPAPKQIEPPARDSVIFRAIVVPEIK